MISFVGAGPGDIDLITVKGRRLLEEADTIIYAGSLVSKDHMKFSKPDAKLYNSAEMTLEEVIKIMEEDYRAGKKVVRLHTGDPSIYGAIQEQMDILDDKNISYDLVPGVSSFTAAASSIKREFTLPGLSQTVILTRIEGRTPVPEDEGLESLASHKASMAIFLSIGHMDRVVSDLIKGYGSEDVPIAVVYKATWEDEKIVIGTLKDIRSKLQGENIKKTAQILVGEFIKGDYDRSRLYDPSFSHGYRRGKN